MTGVAAAMPGALPALHFTGDDYSAARVARRYVRDAARDWKLSPDTTDDLLTVAGELVANALEHGRGGTITLTCALAVDTVTVAVTDEGKTGFRRPLLPTTPSPAAPDAERGRGLLIVATLATRWGSGRTAEGLMVWADVAVRPDEPATD
ncbi:ATP-binding protein [Streptomyces sp. NPDC046939]|uniref:ATP-binding protein n=1 Tax=Streptomyces sp. NPDC046939 TaxID=3155376 RepID=UPI00340D6BC5